MRRPIENRLTTIVDGPGVVSNRDIPWPSMLPGTKVRIGKDLSAGRRSIVSPDMGIDGERVSQSDPSTSSARQKERDEFAFRGRLIRWTMVGAVVLAIAVVLYSLDD
jgi:hypothetical protein